MNALEKKGLLYVAESLLEHRGCAAILCALIHADGRVVSHANASTLSKKSPGFTVNRKRSFAARICWTRAALRDVGLGEPIKTVGNEGYALPEPGRSKVLKRLLDEVEK